MKYVKVIITSSVYIYEDGSKQNASDQFILRETLLKEHVQQIGVLLVIFVVEISCYGLNLRILGIKDNNLSVHYI